MLEKTVLMQAYTIFIERCKSQKGKTVICILHVTSECKRCEVLFAFDSTTFLGLGAVDKLCVFLHKNKAFSHSALCHFHVPPNHPFHPPIIHLLDRIADPFSKLRQGGQSASSGNSIVSKRTSKEKGNAPGRQGDQSARSGKSSMLFKTTSKKKGTHPDGAAGDAQLGLRLDEDVVPKARLEVGLHLGQVEVGPAAAAAQLGCVVEEVEREVEDGGRDRQAVHVHVLLLQVPPARPHKQYRRLRAAEISFRQQSLCQISGRTHRADLHFTYFMHLKQTPRPTNSTRADQHLGLGSPVRCGSSREQLHDEDLGSRRSGIDTSIRPQLSSLYFGSLIKEFGQPCFDAGEKNVQWSYAAGPKNRT